MKSPKKLNKLKLAFITGATKGIGRSTANTFANAGWDLILLSRNMYFMEKLKSELLTTKSKINLVECDLSNSLGIETCVREAIDKYGCPSVLINNAGCAFNGSLVEMDFEQWEQTIQTNLTSVFQEPLLGYCQHLKEPNYSHQKVLLIPHQQSLISKDQVQ